MDATEQQIRTLRSELSRLRRESAARDAEARTAREDAVRARAEAREARRRLDTTPAPPAEQVRLRFPSGRPTVNSGDGRFQAFLGGQVQFDVGGAVLHGSAVQSHDARPVFHAMRHGHTPGIRGRACG